MNIRRHDESMPKSRGKKLLSNQGSLGTKTFSYCHIFMKKTHLNFSETDCSIVLDSSESEIHAINNNLIIKVC